LSYKRGFSSPWVYDVALGFLWFGESESFGIVEDAHLRTNPRMSVACEGRVSVKPHLSLDVFVILVSMFDGKGHLSFLS